ncbi:tyrosine-type recombinase/integrase [Paraburkholderia sp. BR13439]|uniref:tyrosine-type recombinase/integrase n=1 Tax=unclassified Paraburkholderia TaxID=2615204 RepID=UPI0034CD49E5
MMESAQKRFISWMPDLTADELKSLAGTSPHAVRHMFGTQAGAHDVPLDVVRRIPGHASLQTTTIYLQAEKQRLLHEAFGYFQRQGCPRTRHPALCSRPPQLLNARRPLATVTCTIAVNRAEQQILPMTRPQRRALSGLERLTAKARFRQATEHFLPPSTAWIATAATGFICETQKSWFMGTMQRELFPAAKRLPRMVC